MEGNVHLKKILIIIKHSILSLEGLVSIIYVLVSVALFLHTRGYPLDPISVYWVKMFKVHARIMTSMKKKIKKSSSPSSEAIVLTIDDFGHFRHICVYSWATP